MFNIQSILRMTLATLPAQLPPDPDEDKVDLIPKRIAPAQPSTPTREGLPPDPDFDQLTPPPTSPPPPTPEPPVIPEASPTPAKGWRSLLGGFQRPKTPAPTSEIAKMLQGPRSKLFQHIPSFGANKPHFYQFGDDKSPLRGHLDLAVKGSLGQQFGGADAFTGGARISFDATIQSRYRVEKADDIPVVGGILGSITSGETRLRDVGLEYFHDENNDREFDFSGTAIHTFADLGFRMPYLAHAVEEKKDRKRSPLADGLEHLFLNPTFSLSVYGQRNYRPPDFSPFFDHARSAYGYILYLRDPTEKRWFNFFLQQGRENHPLAMVWDKAKVVRAGWFLPMQIDEADSSGSNLFDNGKLVGLLYEQKDFSGYPYWGDVEGRSRGVQVFTDFRVPEGVKGFLGGMRLAGGIGYKKYEAHGAGIDEAKGVVTPVVALQKDFKLSEEPFRPDLRVKLYGEYDMASTANRWGDFKFERAFTVGLDFELRFQRGFLRTANRQD